MSYDQTRSIQEFLNATAAKQPAPGGGSVTALVGALSASMGEMVVNYSLGKKDLEAYAGELAPALAEFNKARQVLLQLMLEDQEAYTAFTAIRKLPQDAPDRKAKLDAATLACIRAPQAMAATCVAILDLCDRMVNFVNYHLLSDLAVCADLAMAATRCAVYNVRINLRSITDSESRRSIEASIGHLLSHAAMLIQRVSPRIWERDTQGT